MLYSPASWSEAVNTEIYPAVVAIIQIAQANNFTIGGDARYNVPSGKVDLGKAFLRGASAAAPPPLTSYSITAINGADKFNDDAVVIKDVFDVVVSNTRDITATCTFPSCSLTATRPPDTS